MSPRPATALWSRVGRWAHLVEDSPKLLQRGVLALHPELRLHAVRQTELPALQWALHWGKAQSFPMVRLTREIQRLGTLGCGWGVRV